jgi:hypothetical protein
VRGVGVRGGGHFLSFMYTGRKTFQDKECKRNRGKERKGHAKGMGVPAPLTSETSQTPGSEKRYEVRATQLSPPSVLRVPVRMLCSARSGLAIALFSCY